jgi:hypothetical protein
MCAARSRVWSVKAVGVGLVIVLGSAAALLVAGYEIAATVVAVGGAAVVTLWPKVLGKLGVRSSR